MSVSSSIALVLLATSLLQGCKSAKPSHSADQLARPLRTGFENNLSAPLGPGGEVVAHSQSEWDVGWRRLGLPGAPPPVTFTREIAVLHANYFGGSPFTYESGVDSARFDAATGVVTVYAHARASEGGVDTSSRKVLAAALRVPPIARVTVHWRLTN